MQCLLQFSFRNRIRESAALDRTKPHGRSLSDHGIVLQQPRGGHRGRNSKKHATVPLPAAVFWLQLGVPFPAPWPLRHLKKKTHSCWTRLALLLNLWVFTCCKQMCGGPRKACFRASAAGASHRTKMSTASWFGSDGFGSSPVLHNKEVV